MNAEQIGFVSLESRKVLEMWEVFFIALLFFDYSIYMSLESERTFILNTASGSWSNNLRTPCKKEMYFTTYGYFKGYVYSRD